MVRHVSRILDGCGFLRIQGHAGDDMVAVGRVRVEDKFGNDFADRAAAFGRRGVSDLVMDVRRRFVSACCLWYPVVLELHRFFVAIARAPVNEDGCAGVALHPTVWSGGGLVKRRKTRVSAWDFASVPGPVGLWRHGSVGWPCIEVRDVDVGFWQYSVGLLVKLCSFLSSLHLPSSVSDLGVGGVSFVDLLILFERWAGERLVLEICLFLSSVGLVVQFQCRVLLRDQALIFGALVGFRFGCHVEGFGWIAWWSR